MSKSGSFQFARPLTVLEYAAAVEALKVVPLLRVTGAHAADMAALIVQRLITARADQLRRRHWRIGGIHTVERAAQDGSAERPRLRAVLRRLARAPLPQPARGFAV